MRVENNLLKRIYYVLDSLCVFVFFFQKNPSTIRQAEEDQGRENFTMNAWLNLDRSTPISQHIKGLCGEAKDSTYVRDIDLKWLADLPGLYLI